jgi:aryl-alcohol dehydrogenase-like predicted oxidoreductase
MTMNLRALGRTGLRVSEISFGCWTLGGLNWINGVANGWAAVDEAEITRAIRAGLDAGVNHFDNADCYGNGRAERVLARALHQLGVKPETVLISSKVGHFPGTAGHAYEPAHIRHQCEQSLINLRRDHLDLYYFHHTDFGPGDRYLEGAVAAMDDLVRAGKVRVKGLCAHSVERYEQLVPVIRPAVLQSRAHALDDEKIREGSRLQQLMDRHDLAFVAFSPLAQGRLLDKYDPAHPPVFEPGDHRGARQEFTAAALAELKPKLELLKQRFGARPEDLAALALNYVLAHPRVCCAIPGFRSEAQARCNLAAAGRTLGRDDVAFIRQVLTN